MTSLKSLAKSAMLGTQNGFQVPKDPGPFGILVPDPDPETALLASAAVVGIGEVGGRMPVQVESREAASPLESWPLMSERAVALIKRMLAGEFEAVLPEFLQRSAGCGVIVPPEVLPTLLGLAKKELRPLVRTVIGDRGSWLAGLNPAWAHGLAPLREEDWETGRLEERVSLLERLRTQTPGRARELVQSTWEQDPPEARAAFVATFSTGSSMEDEPFLEACLDNKRKEVREAALDLLAQLPQSRLVGRLLTRLEPLLRLKSKILGGEALEVTLPDKLDPPAKRDGVGGTVLRKALGEKANWLAQMLSLVPPAYWSRQWNRPPQKLVQAALASEWKEAVLLGWLLAAMRCREPDWADALVDFSIRQDEKHKIMPESDLSALACCLTMEKVESLANASNPRAKSELDDPGKNTLLALLERYDCPWSAALSRAVIASAKRQAGGAHWQLGRALPGFALRIPPELVDEFASSWPEDLNRWSTWIDQFIELIRFRKEMMEAL